MNAKWVTCLLCGAVMMGAEAGIALAQDTMAPFVTSMSRTPGAVDASLSSQQVNFTLSLGDNLSGFHSGSMNWRSPSGLMSESAYVYQHDRTAGDALNGVYSDFVTFDQVTEPGIWTPELYIQDTVGNSISYNASQLAALGFNDLSVSVGVPEPASLAMAGMAAIGVIAAGRRRLV